jgi:hypothetical protein
VRLASPALYYQLALWQSVVYGGHTLRSCSSRGTSNAQSTRICVSAYHPFVLAISPRVPLRRYVSTYILGSVRITRAAFAALFGVHLPEWLPAAWVNGTRYVLLSGREEVGELDRLMSLTEEPFCSAFEAVRPKT